MAAKTREMEDTAFTYKKVDMTVNNGASVNGVSVRHMFKISMNILEYLKTRTLGKCT